MPYWESLLFLKESWQYWWVPNSTQSGDIDGGRACDILLRTSFIRPVMLACLRKADVAALNKTKATNNFR